jgi:2-keto-4-pentenoate hydratase
MLEEPVIYIHHTIPERSKDVDGTDSVAYRVQEALVFNDIAQGRSLAYHKLNSSHTAWNQEQKKTKISEPEFRSTNCCFEKRAPRLSRTLLAWVFS